MNKTSYLVKIWPAVIEKNIGYNVFFNLGEMDFDNPEYWLNPEDQKMYLVNQEC